jgi:hypothetical protein
MSTIIEQAQEIRVVIALAGELGVRIEPSHALAICDRWIAAERELARFRADRVIDDYLKSE